MALILQVTDKGPLGGGIRRSVDLQAGLYRRHGHEVRELLLGDGAPAPSGAPLPLLAPRGQWLPALEAASEACAVLHLHLGFSAISADFVSAAAARAPLVVSLHDVSPFTAPQGAREWLLAPLRRRAWQAIRRHAAAVVAPSRYLAARAVEAGIAPERLHLVPHPVDLTERAATPPSASKVAIYAGLLSGPKGAGLLVPALARVGDPDARLLVLGDGPLRADLVAQARAAGLAGRVEVLGQLPPQTVRARLREARLLLHPSLVQEGLGLVGLEALAEGRPVVGFARGGASDWLRDGESGLVAAPATAEALADGWSRLLADDALADRLGRGGRRLAERDFAPDAVGRRLMAVLETVGAVPA